MIKSKKNLKSNPLTTQELTRYSRNILLSEVGRKGQEKLKESIVTVVGAGDLEVPYILAAAGVGEIRIIDSDKVDLTNLQRQILYSGESLNKNKAEEAESVIKNLNSNIKIVSYKERLKASNIQEIFQDLIWF